MRLFTSLLLLFTISVSAQNFENGFNFNLPGNDSTQGDFLPVFPVDDIDAYGFISIDENGHFTRNGERITFYGANLVAGGAFLDKPSAEAAAARSANFGFNLMRFHHIDNPWTYYSVFDHNKGTRHFNESNVDLLHYQIAQLKKRGIYTNMNLYVSRRFSELDGVDQAQFMQDIAKGVTLFDPQLIELQKEYARDLLTTVNPYTGLSMVDDPAVAMIEINNENSLFRLWRDGDLKTIGEGGELIDRHNTMLDTLWNVFLLDKYGDTESLRAAWNTTTTQGSNFLTNGSFESTPLSSNWQLEAHSGGQATHSVVTGDAYDGSKSVKITITKAADYAWGIQWKMANQTLQKDSIYSISFAAKASQGRSVSFVVQQDVDPWATYHTTNFKIGTDWQTYNFTFTSGVNAQGNIKFSLIIGDQTGEFWVDDYSLGRPAISGLAEDELLENQSVRRSDYYASAGLTNERVMDMSGFYYKLQEDYFLEMADYLRNDLGVKVPLQTTNFNIGLQDLAVQATLDYMDNHAYWDHPHFPNTAWDMNDWQMNNSPMVMSTGYQTISALFAGQKVAGMPYTISEYNHPFPNRYQSESILFLTAYSALHDIDGLMYFEYAGDRDVMADAVGSFFSIHRNTALMSLIPSTAYAYRHGLISKANTFLTAAYSSDDVLIHPKKDNDYYFPSELGRIHGIETTTFEASEPADFSSFPAAPTNPYVSDTDEITWDTNGLLKVDAEQFIGFTGISNKLSGAAAGPVTISQCTEFATITMLSLTGEPLHTARKSLLTISTTVQNSGMIWSGANTVNNNFGSPPSQMKPARTTFTFAMAADSLLVYPLDVSGNVTGMKFTFYPNADGHFVVELDQQQLQTVWFGIELFGEGLTSVDDAAVPLEFELLQNYPNPFNPVTTISWQQPETNRVRLAVYDITGSEVAVLVDGEVNPGRHSVRFDASSLSSGMYAYRVTTGSESLTRKMLLLK